MKSVKLTALLFLHHFVHLLRWIELFVAKFPIYITYYIYLELQSNSFFITSLFNILLWNSGIFFDGWKKDKPGQSFVFFRYCWIVFNNFSRKDIIAFCVAFEINLSVTLLKQKFCFCYEFFSVLDKRVLSVDILLSSIVSSGTNCKFGKTFSKF